MSSDGGARSGWDLLLLGVGEEMEMEDGTAMLLGVVNRTFCRCDRGPRSEPK